MTKYHCLFEQSGHFKNEFKKLGYEAYDYDILNDFNQTDFQIDLYSEINNAYLGIESIFDNFSKEDVILAFFPCIRFENQILLWFRGEAMQQKNWDDEKKLEYAINLHNELNTNYKIISKLVIICLRKKLSLIIENPYSTQHYLTNYWPIKPAIIDSNRHESGDFIKKPTQYYFINIKPKNNFIFEAINMKNKITVTGLFGTKNCQVQRSIISTDYVNRFIREFIIEEE